MALDATNSAPVTPDATSAPAAPDLGGLNAPAATLPNLSSPATAPSLEGTQEFKDYSQATGNEKAAIQKASDIANRPVVNPNVPHARLLSMVQGLSLGLSSFADAAASGGARGGAKEVAEVRGEQQRQKLAAQQAAEAQKNSQIQQQLTVADTNHRLAQNVFMLSTLKQDMAIKDLQAKGEQIRQAGEQQGQAITGADFAATHGGMAPDEFKDAISDKTPVAGQPNNATSFFTTSAKQQLQAGTTALGVNDSYVKKVQDTLADPNASRGDLWLATSQLQSQMAMQSKANDEAAKKADLQNKQQTADPLFKFQSDPKALADPGAQATLQAYIDAPANKDNLNGIAQAHSLITKAGIAQQHAIDLDRQKTEANKNAELLATGGDPHKTGQALYDGDVTLADLKSRGSTPAQIIDAVNEAKAIAKASGGTYNATDEIVGEKSLGEIGNQTFYGSARSLVQNGGMLDKLKAAHDALGNTKLPTFNHYADILAYKAGTPELATYRATLLGAADDYAKVIGGGNPTDSSRKESQDQFLYDLNNGAFDGAVEASRGAVRSQVEGRIGSNRYIQQREGDIIAKANATSTTPSGKAVSLAAARQIPEMKGKTDDQIKAAIQAQGHQVAP